MRLDAESNSKGLVKVTKTCRVRWMLRLVDQGRLRHGDHPVLKMCVANAVVTMDQVKNRKFDKSKSGGSIDALVALSMALAVVNKPSPRSISMR